jgi:hypothetical protein
MSTDAIRRFHSLTAGQGVQWRCFNNCGTSALKYFVAPDMFPATAPEISAKKIFVGRNISRLTWALFR